MTIRIPARLGRIIETRRYCGIDDTSSDVSTYFHPVYPLSRFSICLVWSA